MNDTNATSSPHAAPQRGRPHRWSWTRSVVLVLAAATPVTACRTHSEAPEARERMEQAEKAEARQAGITGEGVVVLDSVAQARAGLRVLPLTAVSAREQVRAYGTVVDLRALADLANQYAAAKAAAERAEANVGVARHEAERVRTLYQDDRNASAKALDAAEGTLRTTEAAARAAARSVQTLGAMAAQDWGPVVSRWLIDGTPAFARLLRQEDVLVHVTLAPDASMTSPPATVRLEARDGQPVAARYVSRSSRTDPRIQGLSFFYVAPARGSGLLSGMNVTAYLAAGPQARGTLVPSSAVVWWQGRAWVYLADGRHRFGRRTITTDAPVTGGFLVADLPPTARVVVRGAQMLLSEESKSEIQVGEAGEAGETGQRDEAGERNERHERGRGPDASGEREGARADSEREKQ